MDHLSLVALPFIVRSNAKTVMNVNDERCVFRILSVIDLQSYIANSQTSKVSENAITK